MHSGGNLAGKRLCGLARTNTVRLAASVRISRYLVALGRCPKISEPSRDSTKLAAGASHLLLLLFRVAIRIERYVQFQLHLATEEIASLPKRMSRKRTPAIVTTEIQTNKLCRMVREFGAYATTS